LAAAGRPVAIRVTRFRDRPLLEMPKWGAGKLVDRTSADRTTESATGVHERDEADRSTLAGFAELGDNVSFQSW
jgi:hypothetical protein